jgi:urease accessory protein
LVKILGFASEAAMAERLHRLVHAGRVEYVTLSREDTKRHRLRVKTDRGTDCSIALPRDQALSDGAVLALDAERAIVVRMAEERWLRLQPRDTTAGLELGYCCGNLHWRVKFDADILAIALEGPERDYLERVRHFIDSGRARRADDR